MSPWASPAPASENTSGPAQPATPVLEESTEKWKAGIAVLTSSVRDSASRLSVKAPPRSSPRTVGANNRSGARGGRVQLGPTVVYGMISTAEASHGTAAGGPAISGGRPDMMAGCGVGVAVGVAGGVAGGVGGAVGVGVARGQDASPAPPP